MDGAVFGVDWQHRRPGRRADPRHQRRRRDERLLVGEGQSLPGLQGRERDRKPGESEDRVDDDVRARGERAETFVADHDVDVGPHELGQRVAMGVADDSDARDVELIDDARQFPQLFTAGERYELEQFRFATQDVEGLGPDRSGGAKERDAAPHCRHRQPSLRTWQR